MSTAIVVDGQEIRLYGDPIIMSDGSAEFVQFAFNFTPEWNGYVKVAQFSQAGAVYHSVLTIDNKCYMPTQVGHGLVYLSVFGQAPGLVPKATTNKLELMVFDSGLPDDPLIPPTPDLYSQLLAKILEAEASQEAAELAATNAQSHAEAAQQTAEFVDTLHDEAKLFRDDAEGFANAAEGYKQEVSGYADEAEGARDEAIEAAEDANRYYASLLGLELVVNVVDGVLKLYAIGGYSPIDILLNDRALEVWRV